MNLYTKYRSQQFSDVVGQEQVVRVLVNAIKLEKVGHAYLFSGPRGTGKTTLARLLAKSLNCQKRKKGEIEPCGDCPSCREINLGTSMDIIEIDAASNRGIDEIRALRDNARFAASGTRYKIFIIDEVHMLTREAFNALLKTLEEPPKHVIFIMATTESHKVPETILSRTLSFDFHLHKLVDIIKQIGMIAKKEGISIDEQSIRLIAQNAKGGMRDAITILDQVSSSSKKIDEKLTREALGLSSFESLALCVKCIFERDTVKALKLLEKLYKDGVDFYQFSLELVELTQKIMLYRVGLENALGEFTKEEKATIIKIACPERSRVVEIVKIVDKLLEAANETKNSQIPELPLELVMVELTQDSSMESVECIVGNTKSEIRNPKYEIPREYSGQANHKLKIVNDKPIINIQKNRSHPERNEGSDHGTQNMEHGTQDTKKLQVKSYPSTKLGAGKLQEKQNDGKEDKKQTSNINFKQIQDNWPEFLQAFEKANGIKTFLENSTPVEIQGDKLTIAVQFGFYKDKLESIKNYQRVNEIFEKIYGVPMVLKFKADPKLVKKVDGTDSGDGSDDMLSEDNKLTSEAEDIFK